MTTADLIKRIIKKGNYNKEDMLKKMDIFLMADRITDQEYKDLLELIEQYPSKQ